VRSALFVFKAKPVVLKILESVLIFGLAFLEKSILFFFSLLDFRLDLAEELKSLVDEAMLH